MIKEISSVLGDGVSKYSEKYQRVLDKADEEGIVGQPSDEVKELQDFFINIVDLDHFDFLYLFASDAIDERFGLINLANPDSYLASAINSPTFQKFGFSGSPNNIGFKRYIDTMYNPFVNGLNYAQNDALLGIYQYSIGLSGSESTVIGNDAGKTYLSPSFDGDLIYGAINSDQNDFGNYGSSIPFIKPTTWTIERSNATQHSVYNDQTLVGTNNKTSKQPNNSNILLFNTNGSSDSVISAAWAGRSGIRINNQLDYYINALSLIN